MDILTNAQNAEAMGKSGSIRYDMAPFSKISLIAINAHITRIVVFDGK